MYIYDKDFYNVVEATSTTSAEIIVPMICDIFNVNSVVDFGCATGIWLNTFKKNGVSEIDGYDGPYVQNDQLVIDASEFHPCDLTDKIVFDRKYDLAMSLEVAEHLPSHCSKDFVTKLTNASDIVLFSAAVPGQGGSNHINEQWPSYWSELFKEKGYVAVDYLREIIWDMDGIADFYRQNIMIYINKKISTCYFELLGDYFVEKPKEYMRREVADKRNRRYDLKYGRSQEKYLLSNLLCRNILSGKLEKYFNNIRDKKIAIYGMGEHGKILLEFLKTIDIQPKMLLDKEDLSYTLFDITKDCEEIISNIDILVVTPIYIEENDINIKSETVSVVMLKNILC